MYELLKLPYLFQDLEPFIDTHTMGLHYHKHYQNYLNQLNSLLIKNKYDYRYSLEELINHIDEFPMDDQDSILYNLGGVLNHNLYFMSMSPIEKQKPLGKLKEHIDSKYGSYDKFLNEFKNMALKIRGSGYTFLVLKNDGQIAIMNVSNQETPLSFGYIPLFNVDIWEHAYYLNYKNNRSEYFDNFLLVADFTNANQIFNRLI